MLIIREETALDHEAVYDVVKRAFESAEHSDGNEQYLVAALRKSAAFLPALSLVAEMDGAVVGHVLFSKVAIGAHTELALAPLSVSPEYQRRGIGTALVRRGHAAAAALGFHCAVVLGSEDYYPRLGYVPAAPYQIEAPFDVPSENFMVCCLAPAPSPIRGTVVYAPEFGLEQG